MAGLNVSMAFFISIICLCEVTRRFSKRIFPPKVYFYFASELMLRDIGPWGGGFGPDVSLTLLFLLFSVHGATSDGSSANPMISLQEFLALDFSLKATVAKLLAQFVGMEVAFAFTKKYWSRELTDFHIIQNLMAQDCSSSISTSVSHGIFVEALCSFFFQLVVLRFQMSALMYRIPIVAITVTALAYAAAPFTGAFFNPALAYVVTFTCSGNSSLEYFQVYWLAPITGMLIALFLYQGNIPRLFQTNLLYSQKNKYRIPKGKAQSGAQNQAERGRSREEQLLNSN
uniref:Aquaporin n=1 Tax=Varanus komodoensis TaxID=61221 RepID=A0A8D2JB56_VARKO